MRYWGAETLRTTGNQLLIKETNAKLLFTIVSAQKRISRTKLAEIAGLSPSTVSVLTDELIRGGFLIETGTGKSSPTGRRPIYLEVDPNGLQIPCFAFRPDGLLLVLYDLTFHVIEQQFEPYPDTLERHPKAYTAPSEEAILRLFDTLLDRCEQLDRSRVRAMTLSFYGAFLQEAGCYTSGVLGWQFSAAFIEGLCRHLHAPLMVANAALLMAYAENTRDNGYENLLYLHIDRGVGSGIVLNGRPYSGKSGISGEIGQLLIKGEPLEGRASVGAILEAVRQCMLQGGTPYLAELGITPEEVTLSHIRDALTAGDNGITAVMQEIVEYIGIALHNTLCILGTTEIVVGGVEALGPVFLEMLSHTLVHDCGSRIARHSPLRYASFSENGDCLGAAKWYISDRFTVII